MAIIGTVLGSVFVTLWNFAWKKIKKELVFDLSYIFTMFISAIASMAILPVFFINSALPPNNGLFVFLATASMSGLLNLLVNAPVSYALGKMAILKQALCAANISSVTLSTAVSKSKAAFTAIAVVGLVFLLAGTAVFAAVTYSKTVTSTGSVTAIGNIAIFSDSTAQTSLNSVTWGNIDPGSSVTTTLYVKNTGNVPMTYAIASAGWTPATYGQYLTISWSYQGQVVQAGNLQKVDLTLASANNAPGGSFSVNIIVTGTSQ
jgi:hypothetical protein